MSKSLMGGGDFVSRWFLRILGREHNNANNIQTGNRMSMGKKIRGVFFAVLAEIIITWGVKIVLRVDAVEVWGGIGEQRGTYDDFSSPADSIS